MATSALLGEVRSPNTNFVSPDSTRKHTGQRETRGDSIELLLQIEERARAVGTCEELQYFIANESRGLLGYRQAIVFEHPKNQKQRIVAISSLAIVDRSAAFTTWMEQVIARLEKDAQLDGIREFNLSAYNEVDELHLKDYPFTAALWLPLSDREGRQFAGMLLLREKIWTEQKSLIAKRLGATYAHAWRALEPESVSLVSRLRLTKGWLVAAVCTTILAMFVPVSLTTLAPVEVVAARPQVVAAPMQGVIESINVDPNAVVASGDVLYRFVDTDFRNRFEIAENAAQVAAAKLRRAQQSAFESTDESRNVVILEAELRQSELELAYAQKQLDKVEVRAKQDGLALYSARKDWLGKPVVIGERVMQIADPANIEFQVNVPVKDSIVLRQNARVRVYLDADPVNPLEARVVSASYHAQEIPGQILAYRVIAAMVVEDLTQLRIGLRGTAKVYGERVSLFFYLFRRPFASVRQHLGL